MNSQTANFINNFVQNIENFHTHVELKNVSEVDIEIYVEITITIYVSPQWMLKMLGISSKGTLIGLIGMDPPILDPISLNQRQMVESELFNIVTRFMTDFVYHYNKKQFIKLDYDVFVKEIGKTEFFQNINFDIIDKLHDFAYDKKEAQLILNAIANLAKKAFDYGMKLDDIQKTVAEQFIESIQKS
jgi:hypothetical protein